MGLSPDPEKRARQIANLQKGPAKAAQTQGLPVLPYDDPGDKPPPKKPSRTKKPAADPPSSETAQDEGDDAGNSPMALLLVWGGVLLLLLFMFISAKGVPHVGP